MIYIIHPDVDIWNFVLKDIDDNNNVVTRPLNRYCAKWQIAIRKKFTNFTLFSWFLFNKKMRNELKSLKKGDSIVLCDYKDTCLIKTISTTLDTSVNKYYWIWNPIKKGQEKVYKQSFKILKEKGFIPSTFDPNNAEQFNIRLCRQFFRMNLDIKLSSKEEYDFYFIGYPKNREKDIRSLEHILSNYRTFFKIVHNNQEYISYEDNLKYASQSRCLVDIIQKGQLGMSLRPLEALALHKKLISNNRDLLNMDFYHPHNIFIIGIDSIKEINHFMKTPMVNIGHDIMQRYDVSTWLMNFL